MTTPTLVILAGGANSRFAPLREKSLYPFMGESLLEKQLKTYIAAGFEHAVIIANPGNQELIAETLTTSDIPLPTYIAVQDEPLGMGHALLQAKETLAAQDFPPIYVCQVNDVVDPKLHHAMMDAFKSGKAVSYLAGYQVDSYFPGGYLSVEFDDQITGLVEKPGAGNEPSDLVNIVAHIHTDTRRLFTEIDLLYANNHPHDDHYEVAMAKMMADMRFECVRYVGRWHPIKYPWHVLDVTDFYLSQIEGQVIHPDAKIVGDVNISGNVWIDEGARIFPGASIVGPAYIGKNAIVGNQALVRESHVGPESVVGHTSEVARSYLGRNVHLHRAVVLDSVAEENVNFSAGCITANFRIDGGHVKSTVKGERLNTGRNKLGAIVGTDVFIGIQSGTMPGVKIGANAEVGAFTNITHDLDSGMRRYAVQSTQEVQATGKA